MLSTSSNHRKGPKWASAAGHITSRQSGRYSLFFWLTRYRNSQCELKSQTVVALLDVSSAAVCFPDDIDIASVQLNLSLSDSSAGADKYNGLFCACYSVLIARERSGLFSRSAYFPLYAPLSAHLKSSASTAYWCSACGNAHTKKQREW